MKVILIDMVNHFGDNLNVGPRGKNGKNAFDLLKLALDSKAAWTVTQEQERKLDEKQKQIDEDMKKLEQEKKDLDVPKLQARIRQLEGQLKAKAKKRKSREGQINQRAKFAELDKQSKNSENKPPAAQKRQNVVG